MNGVEELVSRIQNGEEDLMHDLWNKVEWFVSKTARKYALLYVRSSLASTEKEAYEDIYNGCGYPALCAAVRNFDPERSSFLNYLSFFLRREIRAFYGISGDKRDASFNATSLNIVNPVYEQELINLLVDETDYSDEVESSILREELRGLLDAAISELTEKESEVIRRRYYNEETLESIAESLGVTKARVWNIENKAFRKIKSGHHSQQLYEHLYPGIEYYFGLKRTSLRAYSQTQERATEYAALRILELKDKYNF